jgi:hypothetical protein
VRCPEGADAAPGLVWKLGKAMNGLKQSSRAWYKTLRDVLGKLGYDASTSDSSSYVKNKRERSYVLVYVDDLLIAGSHKAVVSTRKSVSETFKVKDEGEAKFFLGFDLTGSSVEDVVAWSAEVSQGNFTAMWHA